MIVETLRQSKIFSHLTGDELKRIAAVFEKVNFKKDDCIFFEGDHSEWFYIGCKGRIKILKHTVSGKDIILEIISPGDVFGGVAVLDRKPYPASAQAMEHAAVIRISRKTLFKIMDEYPALTLEAVKYFSERLRNAHNMLRNIATERVENRIASLLLKLSEKVGVIDGEAKKIDIPLTRQEIAEMVGTTVETTIRTMSKFKKQGIIKASQGKIVVNVNTLKEFLED
ncbi:MAG TPA: Crp/Fnr family transcriptional regulator [Nitrospiraceae bacterium]|nr:Crp/Fnr family transcriptional regulator [Nitrospiraceae bacterium]